MMKFTVILLLACLSIVFAQDGGSAAAARAARLDALRQLGEMIQGVRIDSSTTVQDFITQNDEIRTDFEGLVKGANQVGNVKYNNDGTVEVTLEIKMDELVYWMRTMTYKHTHGDARQCDKIPSYNGNKPYFRATGSGAIAGGSNIPNNTSYTNETYTPPTDPYANQNTYNQNYTNQTQTNTYGSFDWSLVTGQGKLLAKRAAQVDAYRNLGEVIQGVRIDAKTIVRDFVTESDQIRASFNGIVQGAQFVGEPRYSPDGVVEVTAQVDLRQVISALQNISRRHNSRIQPQRFGGMNQYYSKQVVQATGSGAVDPKYIRSAPVAPIVKPVVPVVPVVPAKPYVPEWADRTIKVTGSSAIPPNAITPGQGRLMAERGAQVDAYRLLAEQIYGLQLKSQTTVKDFITENDTIQTEIDGRINGAQIIDKRMNENEGTVEVDVELWLGHVWQAMEAAYRRQN